MRRAVALAVLLVLAAVACGDDAAGDGTSGIRGRALAGPQCPVEIAGTPCPDEPWQGTVVAIDTQTGDRHTAESDASGRFELALDPGTYELSIEVQDGGPPFAKPQTVTVEPGAFADVTLSVDTGIR
jgi:carboxypeptidase family protein